MGINKSAGTLLTASEHRNIGKKPNAFDALPFAHS